MLFCGVGWKCLGINAGKLKIVVTDKVGIGGSVGGRAAKCRQDRNRPAWFGGGPLPGRLFLGEQTGTTTLFPKQYSLLHRILLATKAATLNRLADKRFLIRVSCTSMRFQPTPRKLFIRLV